MHPNKASPEQQAHQQICVPRYAQDDENTDWLRLIETECWMTVRRKGTMNQREIVNLSSDRNEDDTVISVSRFVDGLQWRRTFSLHEEVNDEFQCRRVTGISTTNINE